MIISKLESEMLKNRYKHNITNIMNSITVLAATKKGALSSLMDFFHRSIKVDDAQSNVIVGPVKPKPVPAPAKWECPGEHKYSQPKAIDCITRLIALTPQDGGAFFNELSDKYSTLSNATMPEVVTIARNEAGVDYIDLIQKACSNDKSINLDSYSKLLGLHAVMTEADCFGWVDDMNLLRKGFGDAVLATVVSKYSVDECREILGNVYRSIAA
jgi:hypothetical protein